MTTKQQAIAYTVVRKVTCNKANTKRTTFCKQSPNNQAHFLSQFSQLEYCSDITSDMQTEFNHFYSNLHHILNNFLPRTHHHHHFLSTKFHDSCTHKQPHLVFIPTKTIDVGDELLFDYNDRRSSLKNCPVCSDGARADRKRPAVRGKVTTACDVGA